MADKEYIEREKLLEHLKKDPLFDLVERYGITGVIQSIPAADVRPVVRGRWELLQVADEAGDKWNRWFCSECGHVAAVGWEHTRDGAKPKYNFCPNCGAEMEES